MVTLTEIQSLPFPIQPSQHNTLTRDWNVHSEPLLHRIKRYRIDQCAQALTSKVLGCPPLGWSFASFSFLGSNPAQLGASISGDSGTVSLVQFIDHVVFLFQLDIASLGNLGWNWRPHSGEWDVVGAVLIFWEMRQYLIFCSLCGFAFKPIQFQFFSLLDNCDVFSKDKLLGLGEKGVMMYLNTKKNYRNKRKTLHQMFTHRVASKFS